MWENVEFGYFSMYVFLIFPINFVCAGLKPTCEKESDWHFFFVINLVLLLRVRENEQVFDN